MQIIKPKRLGLIHKTYQLKSHQFAVGALAFFTLDNSDAHPLIEYDQWQKVLSQLPMGEALDMGFSKPCAEFLVSAKSYFHQHGLMYHSCPSVELSGVKKRVRISRFQKKKHQKTISNFMPVDVLDKQRSQYNGTYDKQWIDTVHPGLPHDTNPFLFNCAPTDQQFRTKNKKLRYLLPGSAYHIQDMHPTKSCISGHLPNINVRLFANIETNQSDDFCEINTVLETVWFFPEINMGISLYRGSIEVHDSDGLDVKALLMAYENADDTPREYAYYKNVFSLRTNPDTALAHLFNESQLMPIKTDAEIEHMSDLIKIQEDKEHQQVESMRKHYTEQALETIKKSIPKGAIGSEELEKALHKAPSDQSSVYDIPAIPTAVLASGDFDLTPMLAAVDKVQDTVMQELDDKQKELDKLTETYQQEYQDQTSQEKNEEPLEDIQQRMLNPVYVFAHDLKEQRNAQGGNGIVDVINNLPPEAKQQLNNADDLDPDALAKAFDVLLETKRKARQGSPSNTQKTHVSSANNIQARTWLFEMIENQVSLSGRDFSGLDLSGICFSGIDLRDVMLEGCNLNYCDFSECNMSGAVLTEAQVSNASFIHADLSNTNFSLSRGENTLFHYATLDNSQFIQADYKDAEFNHIEADHIIATEANFIACFFEYSVINNALMSNTDFTASRLDEANITASIFLQSVLTKTHWKAAMLDRCMLIDVSAHEINFYRATLEKVQFSNVGDLEKADFSYAHCNVCGFRGVNVSQSCFSYAALIECDFGDTQFNNAQLNDAIFKRCVMTKASLTESICQDALFNESLVRKVNFKKSNLTHAEFYNCTLEGNHLENAAMRHLSIAPQPEMK